MDEVAHVAGTWKAAAQPMTVHALTFDAFFLDESDRLLRVLCVITGSRSQAEDIAQEAFLKVFERWDSVAAMENPQGYLNRTAMNQFRSEYRRAARTLRRVVASAPEHDDVFARVEDRDQAAQALATLTPRQRAALVLTEALGYSGEEAGTMLGIKASTVHALTHQARAALAETRESIDD
jgi:RNA polymerase sigma factor (sigma-70 family)